MAQYGPRTQEAKTKLVVHRYGSHYVLVSAELPNTDHARTLQAGKVEGRTAQTKPEIVEITGK